jgi:hypothetical protein
MNTKIEERKKIILSMRSNYGEKKKGVEKRIEFLKGMNILNVVLTILCGGIILASIILEPFGFEFFKWQKMGLLTLLSLGFVLKLPEDLFEFQLLKHFKILSIPSDFTELDKLNLELKHIIDKLNRKIKYHKLTIPLAVIIIILAFMQILSETLNPYWNYAKIPILLFFGMILTRFYLINKSLTKNIAETEKYFD